jgi:hypothetical protein
MRTAPGEPPALVARLLVDVAGPLRLLPFQLLLLEEESHEFPLVAAGPPHGLDERPELVVSFHVGVGVLGGLAAVVVERRTGVAAVHRIGNGVGHRHAAGLCARRGVGSVERIG